MSGKITCDVIRDLMILCEDDVCSEDSRRLIEEHISECEECRKIYEMTNAQIPEMIFKETNKDDYITRIHQHVERKIRHHPIKKKTVYTLFHVYVKMPNLKPHTFYNGEKQESKEGREVKKGQ